MSDEFMNEFPDAFPDDFQDDSQDDSTDEFPDENPAYAPNMESETVENDRASNADFSKTMAIITILMTSIALVLFMHALISIYEHLENRALDRKDWMIVILGAILFIPCGYYLMKIYTIVTAPDYSWGEK